MKYSDSRAFSAFPWRGLSGRGMQILCLAALLLVEAAPGWAQSGDLPTVTIRTVPSGGSSVSKSRPQEARPARRRRRRIRRAVTRRPTPPPATTAPDAPPAAAPKEQAHESTPTRRRSRRVRTVEPTEPRVTTERLATEPKSRKRDETHLERETSLRSGESAVALNTRGFRLNRQRRFAEAEPYLRRAVELQPDFGYALYNLGVALLEQGKASEALRPLDRTAALQPNRWEPQERLAEAYAATGKLRQSRAAAARARELRSGRSARN